MLISSITIIIIIIINIFLIYKLLTPLVDYGSKPTCPEREVNVQSDCQDQMSQINTGKTVYVGNA